MSPRNRRVFDEEACTRCGKCFNECPELRLPLDLAKQQVEALIRLDTENATAVLNHCTTCFSCNLICPNDCKPYQLILENWNKLYRERGAPPIYRTVCPTMEKNIWQLLFALMPAEEARRVEEWMNTEPGEDILLVGNYTHLLSFILGESKILDSFTTVDLIDHWEGGAYLYQGGYLDVVERIAEKCRVDFDKWGVKRVTSVLDAVHHIFTVANPAEMGVQYSQEFRPLNQWLLEKVQSGEIALQEPVKMSVTIHDNCFSKTGGDAYWDPPRALLERAGCEIREMAHTRAESLCCGFGAGASWKQNFRIPFDMLATSLAKFREAEATGAEALVTYCGGCLYLLWAARELFQSKLKVFHHLEVVRMAMGEPVDRTLATHVRRAWDVIAIITYHLVLGLFKRPFWIREVSFGEHPLRRKRFLGLKILRKLFDLPLVRSLYRKIFLLLLPKLRTKRPWLASGGS
ncbi:MAG: (Fe-S)-binding protein [Promethearchaeota archaeon]